MEARLSGSDARSKDAPSGAGVYQDPNAPPSRAPRGHYFRDAGDIITRFTGGGFQRPSSASAFGA